MTTKAHNEQDPKYWDKLEDASIRKRFPTLWYYDSYL